MEEQEKHHHHQPAREDGGAHAHPLGHVHHHAADAPDQAVASTPVGQTPAGAQPAGTIYTCPMHPEVRQEHPGQCPKCGMTLEPMLPDLDEENPELREFQRRFWWTLPLTVVVFILAMFGHDLSLMNMSTQSWLELALATPIVLWGGWPFFHRGWQSVMLRSPNMWTLISLGTGAAYWYSVVATMAPQAFPRSFIAMGRVAVYFEAAAVIISLTLLGQMLELKARSQTSAAIKSLLGLAPKTARRLQGKTGTLIEGKPAYDRAVAAPGWDETEVLRLAASLDQGSEHPLADAIVRAARDQGLLLDTPVNFESGTGIGVRGDVGGRHLALGNTRLMQQLGAAVDALVPQAEALRTEGASVMYLAVDGQLAGLLAVSDPVKSTTPDALAELKAAGMRIVMATGDGQTTAKAVGARLGIVEVHGEVKPADKLQLVERLQREGRVVAMAGDGINDAPALARADVGVAMGTGTDVAMNSAQVTLVKGDLRGIATARSLSMATVANMKQNLAFAFVYNALGIPIAAGVLYPLTGWLMSPLIAAVAMSLSSVSVISNALRLQGFKQSVRARSS